MKKNYILTPGPTPVPPEVLAAGAKPIIHHRTGEFSKIFETALENLKYVFQTKNDVLVFAASKFFTAVPALPETVPSRISRIRSLGRARLPPSRNRVLARFQMSPRNLWKRSDR